MELNNEINTIDEFLESEKWRHADIRIKKASELVPEAVGWIWNEWLAIGKLAILAGQAGTGKTTISMNIASIISNGGTFPDGTECPVGGVLVWSGEDGIEDTLLPRLMAANANLENIHFLEGVIDDEGARSFDPAKDMPNLSRRAAEINNLSLLIIDPIVNAVAGDGNSNNIVRKALQPIVDFAAKNGCAVIGISHFSKGSQGKDPLERVTGSIAYGALARVVWSAAKITDEEDVTKRIMCRTKNNLGKDEGGFEYRIEQTSVGEGITSSYIAWGNQLEGSARELLDESNEESSNGCAEFVEELLAGGRMAVKEVMKAGISCGYSQHQINRAKRKLNIKSHRSGSGVGSQVYWDLPPHKNSIDCIHSTQFEAQCMPSMEDF